MEVGIIGLPQAGKTTIFNALTHSQAQTNAYGSGKGGINIAVVDVPDARVDTLSAMFRPRKTVFAKVQFSDVSGVARGQAQVSGLDLAVLNALSKCDALLQVVRAFSDEQVAHPEGSVDALRDVASLRLELIISDLGIVERKLERIDASLKKARADERPRIEAEQALMLRLKEALEAEQPIADVEISDDEERLLRNYQFLTAKPALVVLNLDEDGRNGYDLNALAAHRQTLALELRGALEMEIAQLPAEERALFLESYNIAEPGLNVLVRESYNLLGLMSFFTVGEDEVRAWTVRRGATAVEAAGAIHSDLARGFIRAEVISYDDMIACGTLAEARNRGKLRLEGKTYVVQDG
ncbi:MAG: redox-regulated ATPase YchF, partial [Chloroflexi bacterium]|nr:redox-regulated ATPase YchF [Chloroflexota bacterium]